MNAEPEATQPDADDESLWRVVEMYEDTLRQGHSMTPQEWWWFYKTPQTLRERLHCVFKLDQSKHPASGAAAAPAPAIPGFEILHELGRGGMGVVYKARQVQLGRLVALKVLLNGAHADAEQLDRFRTEAMTAARLDHEHIVTVYEVSEHEGRPYLVLQLVEGQSLKQQLDSTPQPAQQAAGLVETLALAVHHAHTKHIIHRDLKPGNILLDAHGRPHICDFGLAKRVDAADGHTTRGAILGTPSYMAPEQAAGRFNEVGPPTDVYALGTILYESLTGRPPFRGATAQSTIDQVIGSEPVAPSRFPLKIPRDLETICLKCLEKSPARRYSTALALAEDLRRYREGKPIVARPVGTLEQLAKWTKRRPWQAAVVFLVLFIMAGVGCYAIKQHFDNITLQQALDGEAKAHQDAETARQRAVNAVKCAGIVMTANFEGVQQFYQQGHPKEALYSLEKLVEGFETMVQNAPEYPQFGDGLRGGLEAKALLLEELEQYADAVKAWDRRLRLPEPLTDEQRFIRCHCLARAGDHKRATQEAKELAAQPGAGASEFYNLACIFALAVHPAHEDAPQREQYAARAMELLEKSRDAGFFKSPGALDTMKNDPNLDALKSRDEFKKFLNDLERK